MTDKTDSTRQPPPARPSPSALARITPDAAGIDCGAAEHYVAVPPDREARPVRAFGAFTSDLARLADWLVACGVRAVAMEATGIYWIPLYEMLEARGLEVLLVNARHIRHVPGRKSDVSDCEWLRDLLMVGLLRGSFRPPAALIPLRTYLRHREGLVQHATQCVQRIEKALVQMNLRLGRVVSDPVGVTGLRILRDIVSGQRDPHLLAHHRDPRCQATHAEIEAALTGHYRAEQLFAVQQHLAAYDFTQTQITMCDATIATCLTALVAELPAPTTPLPAARVKARRPRRLEPAVDARDPLHRLTGGIDLTQIDGIAPHTALTLVAEIGTDMTRWPSPKHFTAWLSLAPQNRISGGRQLSSRTQRSANRAAAALRMVAMTLGRGSTALGAYYRRIAARKGKPHAVTATARKLAVLVYRVLNRDIVYRDPGADAYQAQQRERRLRQIRERAATFGFDLVRRDTGEIVAAPA